MSRPEQQMSPAAFAPFDGMPGCVGAARDSDLNLLWCNDEYCRVHRRTRESLIGTGIDSLFPRELAEERARLMRPAIDDALVASYLQFSHGYRWLTRVWPLDPSAFGTRGCFVVLKQAGRGFAGSCAGGSPMPLARLGDLGELSALTPRELEVYYHLGVGLTVNEIGVMLDRSPKTIERHLESLHRKMSFTNRAELVRSAVERGVVDFTRDQWEGFIEHRRNAG